MYRYDGYDKALVRQRIAQFRDQVRRRLAGELSEDDFRPLRLLNGVYLQLHAYMLRVAIPYGTLSAAQMRTLARLARRYDRGYGHFTTRQNVQFNWVALEDVPDMLAELAEVDMHAIQTSGNAIRNVTADHYAGVAAEEVDDPRIWCEVIRQWSTLHPEHSFLPRKFKIAVTGASPDRAAIRLHDIGLALKRDEAGALGFEVHVGGGQGRTPMVGQVIRPFLPEAELLAYLEAILRVYNRYGRRDNKYKARIKILVESLGIKAFSEQVEAEWRTLREESVNLPPEEAERIRSHFAPPAYAPAEAMPAAFAAALAAEPAFRDWVRANVAQHKVSGHAIASISLKPVGGIPGDATAEQMDVVADLAERYGFGEIRVSHHQNLVLPHIRRADLHAVWQALAAHGLATANLGLATDIVACPGLDYCSLATARSIPIAQRLSERLADGQRQQEIGPLRINISGCINACGHHHVGHIGILGLEKRGEESYQITLGGRSDDAAAIGTILGPGFSADGVVDAVETVIDIWLARRNAGETLPDTVARIGAAPFKEAVYDAD